MEGFQSVKYFVGQLHDAVVKLIPTKTSQLINDSEYVQNSDSRLKNASATASGLMSKDDKSTVDKLHNLTGITWGDIKDWGNS